MKLILHIDGASRGNPGPAAIGVIVTDENGTVLAEIGEYIGETTNNVAEYKALLRGLKEADRLGAQEISVYSDSELLVKQMEGAYRVRHPGLVTLHNQARNMIRVFAQVTLTHVPREQTTSADKLANEVLDLRKQETAATTKATDKGAEIRVVKMSPKETEIAPWGSRWQLLSVPPLALHRLMINPGQRLPYQETPVDVVAHILSGKGRLTAGGAEFALETGDSVFISKSATGVVEVVGEQPLVVVAGLIPNIKGEEHEPVDGT